MDDDDYRMPDSVPSGPTGPLMEAEPARDPHVPGLPSAQAMSEAERRIALRPHNIEAEAALLGALMIDNRFIDSVVQIVSRDDFMEPLHGEVFEKIAQQRAAGIESVNPVTLRPYFAEHPAMKELGGPGYLAKLTGSGAAIIGARDFATQVRDLAMLRRVVDECFDAIARAADTSKEIAPAETVAVTVANLTAATARAERSRPRTAAEMLDIAINRADEIEQTGDQGARTRLVCDVNDVVGPLEPGTQTLIGGRPSMGKSVLFQSMMLGYALEGHAVGGVGLEMGMMFQSARLACDLAFANGQRVSYSDLLRGRLTQYDRLALKEAKERVAKLPFRFECPGRATIEEIEAKATRLAGEFDRAGTPLKVFGVDYVQIVGTRKGLQHREKVDYISERMLDLGKRLGCATILVSQLSRGVEGRPDKRPQLSDLKESGRLEEDADNVILVYRPEFYLVDQEPQDKASKEYEAWYIDWNKALGKVDLIMPKVRHGRPSTRRARFFGKHQAIRGSDYREDTPEEEILL